MTILDMLVSMHATNGVIAKSLEIIKDDYIGLVNDNYELTINEMKEVMVRIPSLEKKNEFVYTNITEYEYPLVMCMRISESNTKEKYGVIFEKFMELYKDKLELFFKDVKTVETLKERIVKTKANIDYATYISMALMVITGLCLIILSGLTPLVRGVLIAAIVIFGMAPLVMQFSKDVQVKKIIDGYLSLVKTEWYSKQLNKQYVFLCNFIG
ncbi:hypothetical protein CLPUN_31350 [Clostridium puniceum]|uniref:Uncharacterized protein n=1 Tax=Clostridium puniceum TaxID=29367 RepID=A0A1S8TD01_9CLOT|nr:hypothetical protein [Clostridium puniceum]OOM75670.1 hypothetical protein CLPUN_31350 [Clostridium puniceum]